MSSRWWLEADADGDNARHFNPLGGFDEIRHSHQGIFDAVRGNFFAPPGRGNSFHSEGLPMLPELTTIFNTLLGVLLGGLINYSASRNVKNHEWRLAIAKEKAYSRQKLYGEFLVEAQRIVVQTRENRISSLSDLNGMNFKFAEISLVGSEFVIKEAQKLADYALTSQSSPPAKESANFFQMKANFIAAARREIGEILSED